MSNIDDKLKASQHESYGTLSLISILIPLAGIILGIAYLTKEDRLDRKLGEHLLVVGVFSIMIYGVLMYVYQAHQQEQLVNRYMQLYR